MLATERWRASHQSTACTCGREVRHCRSLSFCCPATVFDPLFAAGFCNPGATQAFLGLSHEQVKQHIELGHVCWDEHDLLDGVPTGSIRVSFGYMSSTADAQALVDFVAKYFAAPAVPHPMGRIPRVLPGLFATQTPQCSQRASGGSHGLGSVAGMVAGGDDRAAAPMVPCVVHHGVEAVMVYPVKSCGGMRVERWPVGPAGLLYDREWVVVDAAGQALSLKNEARLSLISPCVDLTRRTLTLTALPEPAPEDSNGPGGRPSGGGAGTELRRATVTHVFRYSQENGDQRDCECVAPPYTGLPPAPGPRHHVHVLVRNHH